MDVEAAARRWAETWQRGWNDHDVEPIVALYAPHAIFSTEPFRDTFDGTDGVRRYIRQAFAEEEQANARFGEPIVGKDRAAVPWWATLVENGSPVTLAGTSVVRFSGDGLVVEQWDTWSRSAGRRQPPEWWR